MACYHPIPAYRTSGGDITFRAGHGVGLSLQLPCGQCIGCRLERSRQWALRCKYEASLYSDNCFVTLTYSDDKLPVDGGLRKEHLQLFIKRLRQRVARDLAASLGRKPTKEEFEKNRIRYFACGEYGDGLKRPHYHLVLFNYHFSDRKEETKNGNGDKYYSSALLAQLWTFGFHVLADFSFETAAYVARYCTKKKSGAQAVSSDGAPGYYSAIDRDTGEVVPINPEFMVCSLKPGIGEGWYRRFAGDVYPSGFVIHDGMRMAPPKYFDTLLKRSGGLDELERQRLKRVRKASRTKADRLPDRLRVREAVQMAQCGNFLKRKLED